MIKPEAWLEGAWVEEARNSQRLFFISKELQLNTKFHYIEVTTTSENYKSTLSISKITIKRKSFFTSAYTLSRKKNPKNHNKGKGKEKKRECEREGERKKRKWRKGKKKKKMERVVLKVFSSTPPPSDTFLSTVPSLDIAREQHNSHKG